jgi:GNAT superfamily N-acetyltransferase
MISTMNDEKLRTHESMKRKLVSGDREFVITKFLMPERLDEMGVLRVLAWKDEQGISQDFFAKGSWIDSEDQVAHHWVITQGDRMVAAARLSIHSEYASVPHADLFDESEVRQFGDGPYASFNRLVVAPEFRGLGFSAVLDLERINFARTSGARLVIAQPIETRIQPLEELGFKYLGKIKPLYQMPERQIYFMIKVLH